MKRQNGITKFVVMATAVSVLVAVCAIWGARPAQAIIIIGTKTRLFGVTDGQTVRVSILNAAYTKGGITPCVGIFDLNGNEIAHQESTRSLRVGQGMFFDFDAAAFGLRAGQRAQIRVVAELVPIPNDGRGIIDDGDVAVTVEVFDNASGKTMFFVPATTKGFNPQPEPPASAQ